MEGAAAVVDTIPDPITDEAMPELQAELSDAREAGALEAEAAGDEQPFELVEDSNAPSRLQIVEAVLFSSDAPLAASKIAQALGDGTAREVKQLVTELNERYEQNGSTFRIQEIAGGFQMNTLPEYHPWIARMHKARQESKLSAAAMETLSIVAYKQPTTRAEIEAVRGVSTGDILNRLREMDLVKIVGRAEDLGRPMLYGTTKRFLEVFGLGALEQLPKIESPTAAVKSAPTPILAEPVAAPSEAAAAAAVDEALPAVE